MELCSVCVWQACPSLKPRRETHSCELLFLWISELSCPPPAPWLFRGRGSGRCPAKSGAASAVRAPARCGRGAVLLAAKRWRRCAVLFLPLLLAAVPAAAGQAALAGYCCLQPAEAGQTAIAGSGAQSRSSSTGFSRASTVSLSRSSK